MQFISLKDIPTGTPAKVFSLQNECEMRRRLMDIGLVEGASVTPLYGHKGIRAYYIKGAVVAIRSEDAEGVKCKWRLE